MKIRLDAAAIFRWCFLVLLTVAMLFPVMLIVKNGLQNSDGKITFIWLTRVFSNPIYISGILNSFFSALGTVFFATLLAVPTAWLLVRHKFFGSRFLAACIPLPMILPPFAGVLGLTHFFGPYGTVNALFNCRPIDWLMESGVFAVIFLQALALFPLIYLNVASSISNLDSSQEEAARNLSAGKIQLFRKILLPSILPGYFAGAVLVFIAGLTELGIPLMLNYQRCLSVQIFNELKEISGSPFPYALVCVLLVISLGLYAFAKFLLSRKSTPAGIFKQGSQAPVKKLCGRQNVIATLFCGFVVFLAVLPHAGVILTAFCKPGVWYKSVIPKEFTLGNFENVLFHEMTLPSIQNSLIYSLCAVFIAIVLGFTICWLSEKVMWRGKDWIDVVSMTPLAIPGLVMAFGLIAVCQLFKLDCSKYSFELLVVAYAIRRLPYMVRAISAGLQQVEKTLEEASKNLGAGFIKTARKITIPLIAANIFAGTILTFAFCVLEVSDSLILAQTQPSYPITKTMFDLTGLVGSGSYLAAALGVWAMLLLATALLASLFLLGRKLNGVFRL